MRFFDEQDFLNYRNYLMKSVNEAVSTLIEKDKTIKVVLIGEFSDNRYRVVTVHPFSEHQHVHHPELDHYASLVMDLMPPDMNMLIMEVRGEPTFSRTTESN